MLSAAAPHGITLVSRLFRRLRIEFSVIVPACLAIRHDALTHQHRRCMGQSHAVDDCIPLPSPFYRDIRVIPNDRMK